MYIIVYIFSGMHWRTKKGAAGLNLECWGIKCCTFDIARSWDEHVVLKLCQNMVCLCSVFVFFTDVQ